MLVCPTCGRQNPPTFSVCAACGAQLPGGAPDDMARMMAEKDASRRRSRMIYIGAAVVAAGVLAAFAVRDRMHKGAIAEKLSWVEAWVAKDTQEVGGLWNCITQSNTPMEAFSNANQVQAKVEAAAMVQPKTFSEHVRVECVPNGERAVAAFAAMPDPPAELASAFTAYKSALPALTSGIAAYADRLDQRLAGADLETRIQSTGSAWHDSESPNAESIAFERFLQCAVPGIAQLKDVQALLQALATECYKKDAAAFWQNVEAKCGALVTNVDPLAKPSSTYKASMKKFYESDQRMMTAWADCARRGKKGGREGDLSPFLQAFGAYMEARSQVARAAKKIEDGA